MKQFIGGVGLIAYLIVLLVGAVFVASHEEQIDQAMQQLSPLVQLVVFVLFLVVCMFVLPLPAFVFLHMLIGEGDDSSGDPPHYFGGGGHVGW